jgi:hypothetical protein
MKRNIITLAICSFFMGITYAEIPLLPLCSTQNKNNIAFKVNYTNTDQSVADEFQIATHNAFAYMPLINTSSPSLCRSVSFEFMHFIPSPCSYSFNNTILNCTFEIRRFIPPARFILYGNLNFKYNLKNQSWTNFTFQKFSGDATDYEILVAPLFATSNIPTILVSSQ